MCSDIPIMIMIQAKPGGLLLGVCCLLLQSRNPDLPTDPESRVCPQNKYGSLFDSWQT